MKDTVLVYLFRMFWSLLLGGLLIYSFKRSWNVEHGRKKNDYSEEYGTVIFLDPLVFPICIAFFAVLQGMFFGPERSRDVLFSLGVDLFFFVSIYFSLLLFLLPVLRKRYTARTCAVFWLVPVFLFYQPNLLYHSFVLPAKAVLYVPYPAVQILLSVWLTGFVCIFGFQVFSHLRFSKSLKRNSCPEEDPRLLGLWKYWKKKLEIGDLTRPIQLRRCRGIRTPLTVGLYRGSWITYLPERDFTEEEAELIFSHELHHIQRRDTHTKFFLRFCCALGWLHPLVWLAVRKAEDDLELSCDEIVLRDADAKTRRKYAELLLRIAGDARGYSTCLSASAKTLRYRLRATVSGDSARLGLGLLFLTVAVSGMCVGNLALTTNRGTIAKAAGMETARVQRAEFLSGSEERQEETKIKETDLLSRYLGQIEVEQFLTVCGGGEEENRPALYGRFSDTGQTFFLTEDCLTIYGTGSERGETKRYHVKTPIDWEWIRQTGD